jgi:transposase
VDTYWKPVWQLLEDQVECWLLNAAHLHNVPGRKTDVADAAWIAQLVEHGLVRPSFVPVGCGNSDLAAELPVRSIVAQ